METEITRFPSARYGANLHVTGSERCSGARNEDEVDDDQFQWAAMERLPTLERLRMSFFDGLGTSNGEHGKIMVDVTRLGPAERQLIVDKLISNVEEDNRRLLLKIRERMDKVNVKLPTVEVRFNNLSVEAECEVVHGKPIPTMWNTLKSTFSAFARIACLKSENAKLCIVKGVGGIIKPARMTLLLGPPGCGKTTFLKALAGKLDQSLEVRGEIYYNECQLENLMPQKISAYISQYDLHTPEMTVRETLDFSARCQGVGSRTDVMLEVIRKEKQDGIIPEPLIDAFMKATSISGLERSVQTDYIMKILGMEICANTIVGDAVRRGISGGQKRRLATAEIIVGPKRVLFMDEISNGLDSSTTFQIIACLQQFVHITDATAIISLLQPAPEIFDLFDDIILFAEGKIVYQGPTHDVLQFFEDCGFKCPERKGVADFLQEVISSKDQEQYWHNAQLPYGYISVDAFSDRFQRCHLGRQLNIELSKQNDSILSEQNVLYNSNRSKYSISKLESLKACMDKEVLLMKRNSSIYAIKLVQLAVLAVVTMTVFIRTRMAVDFEHTEYFLGSLFYGIMRMMINGIAELTMTVSRLSVFYKQRDFNFYPAWAYAISTSLLKVPLSLVESFIWTALTYYVIGYTPEVERFLRQFLMLFALHLALMSLFRLIASICRREVTAIFVGNVILNVMFFSGGFIIPQSSMPGWIRWVFWTSLASYAEVGVAVNEFLAPRWKKVMSNNLTIGDETLTRHGLNFKDFFYWISLGVIFGLAILFNIGFILALTFLNSAGKSRAIISHERFHHRRNGDEPNAEAQNGVKPSRPPLVMESTRENAVFQNQKLSKMVLPFEPLTLTFQHIQYSIDTPVEMRKQGFTEKRLQLLHDVTGAFRPGILTALMGISGAGKTTLLDVFAGRKSSGYIEGDIRVGGYPKVQETFARISAYCEQADIHSPQITVEESLIFSAWLRLPSEIDKITKAEFVKDALERIELDEVKDSLVGLPGITGLSNEQRKRLTIAVELVSNPSIIFMDEPTTGLDARAAAIVMRAVKNVANTGRTVVCTIHQPSIHIFEAFDEMILMKKGGQVIFSGPLGEHSSKLLEYFQRIPGLPKIKENHNPATWMLEVTSTTVEATLGLDLAQVYEESSLCRDNLELVKQLSEPPADSVELRFPTPYPCNSWEQFKACTWKQNLSYWRNPEYNYTRLMFMIYQSVLLAALMWQKGQKISNEQDFFNIIGSIFTSMQSVCTCISASTIPVVATERVVLYREKFAGMYSSWAYSIAQVTIELPYILVLGVLFAMITYPTVGFYWSGYKVFWYFYASFCILLGYTYIAMLIVALSPNGKVASISALAFYTLLNLFAGYFMPGPAIPKWWIWCYWISPTSWFLKAIITALYGDSGEEIRAFGEKKGLNSFVEDYFGYHPHQLAISVIVLTMFPILYAFLFAFFTAKLNFQK